MAESRLPSLGMSMQASLSLNQKTDHQAPNAFLDGLKTSNTHKTKLARPELGWKLHLRIMLTKETAKIVPIRSCKIKMMLRAHKKASRSHLWLRISNQVGRTKKRL